MHLYEKRCYVLFIYVEFIFIILLHFTFSGKRSIASREASLFGENRIGTGPANRSPSNSSASSDQDRRTTAGAESLEVKIRIILHFYFLNKNLGIGSLAF